MALEWDAVQQVIMRSDIHLSVSTDLEILRKKTGQKRAD